MRMSDDALRSAHTTLEDGTLLSSLNRMYYAAFYAVCAVLAADGAEYGRHSAVRAALHRDLVKAGRLSVEAGRAYDELFEGRQAGDYEPTTRLEEQDMRELLSRTCRLVEELRNILLPA